MMEVECMLWVTRCLKTKAIRTGLSAQRKPRIPCGPSLSRDTEGHFSEPAHQHGVKARNICAIGLQLLGNLEDLHFGSTVSIQKDI